MLISPPFLPVVDLPKPTAPTPPELAPKAVKAHPQEDPLMDAVDACMASHGVYPIASDRNWHTGIHLTAGDQRMPVRAIADGTVVAYRVCEKPLADMSGAANSNAGFVLLRHEKETGHGRTLRFYSLYMHLLDLEGMKTLGMPPIRDVLQKRPYSLPLWLQCPTGQAVSGNGKTVLRKEIIGYPGRCHDLRELHFEIFMTPADFEAYFGATQIGSPTPRTPTGRDCWGHTYFIIPPGRKFLALPLFTDGARRLEMNARLQRVHTNPKHRPTEGTIEFERLQDGKNSTTLYVEVCFSLGAKYTRVWREVPRGAPELLTPEPVCEQSYEYGLHERARDLYGRCPSDGLELLRFGRIVSTPTLPESPRDNRDYICIRDDRETWFRVTFAPGCEGYVDVNADAIQKLTDADFPFFAGWQKTRGECDDLGLWDAKKLVRGLRHRPGTAPDFEASALVQSVLASGDTPAEKQQAMKQLIADPAVRHLLKGFVCETTSEWDAASLEARYDWMRKPGQPFENRKPDHEKFTSFVRQFQFWDTTGLTPGGKLWYFHPLAFIRHFRRCSWLSEPEMKQLLPVNYMANDVWNTVVVEDERDNFIRKSRNYLNFTLCKYGISTPLRMAAFFAQSIVETTWFKSTSEINGSQKNYAPWYGRGFLQLTNSNPEVNIHDSNYYRYFRWRGRMPEKMTSAQVMELGKFVAIDLDDATQSAGFYWILGQFRRPEHLPEKAPYFADIPGKNSRIVAGGHVYYKNETARRVAAYVNAPGYIYGTGVVNNEQERYSCYSNALVVLTDTPIFTSTDRHRPVSDIPDFFQPREPW